MRARASPGRSTQRLIHAERKDATIQYSGFGIKALTFRLF
jgi:hypothetical protein